MPQLDSSTYASQLFWLGLIFLLIFLGVRYYFAPRLKDLFQRREERFDGKLEAAKKLKEEAEALEQRMIQAVEEHHHAMQERVKQSESLVQKSLVKRKHDLALVHTEALTKLERELHAFKESFFEGSEDIEVDLTKTLVGQLVPFSLDEKIYRQSLEAWRK